MMLKTASQAKVMDSNDYLDRQNQVKDLIYSGKIDEAISLLKQMQRDTPFNSWAFERHAFIALKRYRNYPESAQIAETGLKTNPNNLSLKRILAESLSHLKGEGYRANKLFNELKEVFQGIEKVKLLSSYSDFLLRQGRIKEAQRIYFSILQEAPNDTRTRVDLARSYRMDEQYNECLRLLDEYPQPEDPFWLREKGHCLTEVGEGLQAEPLFRHAREIVLREFSYHKREGFLRRLEPLEKAAQALNGKWQETVSWAIKQPQSGQLYTVWHAIRHKLISSNEVKAGINYLIQVIADNPKNLVVPFQIDRLIYKGNLPSEKRLEIIDHLLQIAPQNLEVLTIAARTYQEIDSQRAEELWLKAWQLAQDAPQQPRFLTTITWTAIGYAQFLRKQDHYEEAYAVVEQARTEWGLDSWELELERAINLARLGSYEEAYHLLEQLNHIQPNNKVILDQMGTCLRAIGKLDEALAIFRQKTVLYPEDLFGWQGLGKTLFELGNHEDALGIFEKLLKENPEDVDTKWFIAQILQYKGEYEKAKAYLKDIDPLALIQRGWNPLFYERKLAELERQRLEQQAELAEAKKLGYLGEMATATAHELNQPVGIIRAATSAALDDLKEGYFKVEDMNPLLGRILAQTDRLAAIIENFRKFARGDRTQREKVELNPLVRRAVENFEEQFKHRNINLYVQLWEEQPPPLAWANPFQLEEVLINLLTNARDAVEGRKDATVWVRTERRKGGGSRFLVEDNGPGLSAEYRQQMFVPFVSTKPTEKGTGLGLYISRRFIDDLGGHLRYEDRPGGGARFIVNLPPLKG